MSHFQIENNKVARLVTDDFVIRNLVAKGLTFQLPNYKFTKAHKTTGWDGSLCFFHRNSNTLDVGLIDIAREKALEIGLDIPVVDMRPKVSIDLGPDEKIATILEGKTLRDYQVGANRAIFEKTRGIIQSPTGSGKTVIAAAATRIANIFGKRVLFITHQKELMYQTHKAFTNCGIDTGLCGDSTRDLRHPTVIGTVQTLYGGTEKKSKEGKIIRRADPELAALLKGADFIFLDEAHRGDTMTFQAVCNECSNAYFRIGLTATPMMKGLFEDLQLISQTGGIIYHITIKDLVDRGLLAQPYIKFIKITAPLLNQRLAYAAAYSQGIARNDLRNQQIIEHAVDFAHAGLTTLILVSKIEHGKHLLEMLARYPGLRIRFIHGSKDIETREEALKALAAKEIDILISSTISDEGVDIPAVSAVILAGGMKSPIKLYQRVGRGMRPKKDANWVLIVDFIDLTNKHLARHSKERFQLIHDEPGFIIVPNFDSIIKTAIAA